MVRRPVVRFWPEIFQDGAPRVRAPVRFTFAEFENAWQRDQGTLDDLTPHLTASPRVPADRPPATT